MASDLLPLTAQGRQPKEHFYEQQALNRAHFYAPNGAFFISDLINPFAAEDHRRSGAFYAGDDGERGRKAPMVGASLKRRIR